MGMGLNADCESLAVFTDQAESVFFLMRTISGRGI
jgi:hypothetical protein